ncbi:MAG: hypothetical protein EZS28_012260 [Streblomastix strix]|uniref:Cation-dependent mannose-6-phosphate receptor n=1 Tax=Streblomastix strix TaxID=222440 RepID=A0A5J4WBL7_9EUKA|nr:MAG: hypothetical protein EZS28_012260 [Streblomastix strix]
MLLLLLIGLAQAEHEIIKINKKKFDIFFLQAPHDAPYIIKNNDSLKTITWNYNETVFTPDDNCSYYVYQFQSNCYGTTGSEIFQKLPYAGKGFQIVANFTDSFDHTKNISIDILCHLEEEEKEESKIITITNDVAYAQFYHVSGCPLKSKYSLSIGWIFIISLVSLCAAYFAIGSFVNAVFLGRKGTKIIPHSRFWIAIPELIWTTIKLIISPCFSGAIGSSYDQLA